LQRFHQRGLRYRTRYLNVIKKIALGHVFRARYHVVNAIECAFKTVIDFQNRFAALSSPRLALSNTLFRRFSHHAFRIYHRALRFYHRALRFYHRAFRFYHHALRFYHSALRFYYRASRFYYRALRFYYRALRFYHRALRLSQRLALYHSALRFYHRALRFYHTALRFYYHALRFYHSALRFYYSALRYQTRCLRYIKKIALDHVFKARYHVVNAIKCALKTILDFQNRFAALLSPRLALSNTLFKRIY
jgi:tetratricopeptide (TPR) repeat protein